MSSDANTTELSPASSVVSRRVRNEQPDLAQLAELVIGMSRFLLGLGTLPMFRTHDFTLTEWVALSVLANEPSINNRQLARRLGVTRQRANQIKTLLERAAIISSTQSPTDGRQFLISLTDEGRKKLAAMNSELSAALLVSLRNKNRLLVRGNKIVKSVLHIVRDQKARGGTDKPKRRKRAQSQRMKRRRRADDRTE